MKKILIVMALLYIGYAYGDQMMSSGAEIAQAAKPAWTQLQEFLNK